MPPTGTAIMVAVAAAVLPVGFLGPLAAADDEGLLGGVAGIVVDPSYCTLNTIGHDNTGELVGFTAAHCGGPGAQVVAEGADHRGPVATLAAADGGLDSSVIQSSSSRTRPTGWP